MKRLFLVIACVLLLAGTAGADTYDLRTDFSSTSNPHGTWSFNKGSSTLPSQPDYDSTHGFVTDQQAWAQAAYPFQGHVPVWLQASKDNLWDADVKQGDILMHPSHGPSTLPPYAEGNVTWTSPLTGVVDISGNVWFGESTFAGRSVDWVLYFNGTPLTSGTVSYGDAYNRDNPMQFGVLTKNVNPSDVIMFQAVGTSGKIPWFIGVNLTIDATPVPLPPSVLLFGAGLLGLPLLRRNKTRN